VAGMTVDWVLPVACAARVGRVAVTAGGPRTITRVSFRVDGKRVATTHGTHGGLWAATIRLRAGKHALTATATDVRGHSVSARHMVRTCGASR
jgi:hypothetical protein